MVRRGWIGMGVRRLEMFSGQSKSQWLLTGGLIVLIVGSLVLFGMSLFEKKRTRPEGFKDTPVVCVACNAKWVGDKKLDLAMRMVGEVGQVGKPRGADCPKCGAKGTVYRMIRCPQCQEVFEEAWFRMDSVPANMERTPCPKCKYSFGSEPAPGKQP